MSKIYLVRTNAYTALVELDRENEIARFFYCDETVSPSEVEDTSSWDSDFDFNEIANMIDNEIDCEILGSADYE